MFMCVSFNTMPSRVYSTCTDFFVVLCLLKCKGHEDKSQRKPSGNLFVLMTLGFLYKINLSLCSCVEYKLQEEFSYQLNLFHLFFLGFFLGVRSGMFKYLLW